MLLQKREEVGIISQENTGNVRIIESAQPPLAPTKPNVLLNLMLGLVLGLMGGAGAAFVKESVGNTIKSQKEAEELFGEGVIAAVPHARIGKKESLLVVENKNGRAFMEGMRMLRSNLL